MRERFRHIIEILPPTGIAVHGTTLERARLIEKNGFDPKMSRSLLNGYSDNQTFYVVQPPITPAPLVTFRNLLGDGLSYLNRAVNTSEERITAAGDVQALILFIPPKELPDDLKKYGTPFIAWDSRPIPPENILGVIQVEKGKRKMDKVIFRDCVAVLQEKGVIDFAKPQQPQAK